MKNLVWLLWVVAALALAQVPGNPTQPSLENVPSGNVTSVYVNNPLYAPITASFEVSGTNFQSDQGNAFTKILPARARTLVFSVKPSNNQAAWTWNLSWQWTLGDINAKPEDVVYDLPYVPGQGYLIGQGYGGKLSHNTPDSFYALDFLMPEGTAVCAAREGIVVAIENSNTIGGNDPNLKSNYITVLHPDGTLGQYVHLRYWGNIVQVGDSVFRGQPIGFSGNTGYSTAPHLHFQVSKATPNLGSQTLPVRFRSTAGVGQLVEGQTYARP